MVVLPGVGTPSLLLESSGDVRCSTRVGWLIGPLYQACRLFLRGVTGCSCEERAESTGGTLIG